MIALEIVDVKDFMNKLLKTEVFDHFLLQEATIQSVATFQIDGTVKIEVWPEEPHRFFPFEQLKTQCFDLIKGKQTPSYFKFVFLLSEENLEKTLASLKSPFTIEDVTAVSMNLRFSNQKLILTTGVSYRIFTMDKSFENEWDRMVSVFLKKNEIPYVSA